MESVNLHGAALYKLLSPAPYVSRLPGLFLQRCALAPAVLANEKRDRQRRNCRRCVSFRRKTISLFSMRNGREVFFCNSQPTVRARGSDETAPHFLAQCSNDEPISRAGHFRYFLIFSIIKNDFFCIFYQVNNLFLHQSYLESPLPVKLT